VNIASSSARTQSILVVDDAEQVRRTTVAQLGALGYRARGAADGAAALEDVTRECPDLVVCDLRMPGMDGLQLIGALRKSVPDLPVIVMSGAGLLLDAVGALKLGAWDYVEKPVPLSVLEHAVGRALERAALLQENRRYRDHLEAVNEELRTTLRLLADDEAAGRQIQFRLLPKNHQHFGPFEFSRELVPSAFMSGDFIDAFVLDDRRWGFYLADVSGHGVASALVTVLLRTFVHRHVDDHARTGAELVTSPSRLLQSLNEEMAAQGLDEHFTIFYGVVDNVEGSLLCANAGQYPWPLVFDGTRTIALEQPGLPIGLFPRARYDERRFELPEELVLAAFSDGLLEILPQKSLAGKQRFLTALFARPDVTVEQVRHELQLDAQAPFPDDIAMLLIKRGGANGKHADPAGVLRP